MFIMFIMFIIFMCASWYQNCTTVIDVREFEWKLGGKFDIFSHFSAVCECDRQMEGIACHSKYPMLCKYYAHS